MRFRPARLLVAALLASLAGCAGSLEDPERFTNPMADGGSSGGCGDVPTRVLAGKCGGSGCHNPVGPQLGLDLESPGVAARVVGVAAKGCVGVLANPADPDKSVLYTKLLATTTCGSRMPLARPSLSAADTACVRAWIAAQ